MSPNIPSSCIHATSNRICSICGDSLSPFSLGLMNSYNKNKIFKWKTHSPLQYWNQIIGITTSSSSENNRHHHHHTVSRTRSISSSFRSLLVLFLIFITLESTSILCSPIETDTAQLETFHKTAASDGGSQSRNQTTRIKHLPHLPSPLNAEILPLNHKATYNTKDTIIFKVPSEANQVSIASCLGPRFKSYLGENQIPSPSGHHIASRDTLERHEYILDKQSAGEYTFYILVEPVASQDENAPTDTLTFQALASSDIRIQPLPLTREQRSSVEAFIIVEGSVRLRWRTAAVQTRGDDSSSYEYAIYGVPISLMDDQSEGCNYATICGIQAKNCKATTFLDWSMPSTSTSEGYFEQNIRSITPGQEKDWIYVVLVRPKGESDSSRYNIYFPFTFRPINWRMQLLTAMIVLIVAFGVCVCLCALTCGAVLLVRYKNRASVRRRKGYQPPTTIAY